MQRPRRTQKVVLVEKGKLSHVSLCERASVPPEPFVALRARLPAVRHRTCQAASPSLHSSNSTSLQLALLVAPSPPPNRPTARLLPSTLAGWLAGWLAPLRRVRTSHPQPRMNPRSASPLAGLRVWGSCTSPPNTSAKHPQPAEVRVPLISTLPGAVMVGLGSCPAQWPRAAEMQDNPFSRNRESRDGYG